jgi:hypothetical protein
MPIASTSRGRSTPSCTAKLVISACGESCNMTLVVLVVSQRLLQSDRHPVFFRLVLVLDRIEAAQSRVVVSL